MKYQLQLKEFKEFSGFLAQESGNIIKRYFRQPISVSTKADQSPVTIADQKAEELMRNHIMKTFPDHGILGEEFGTEKPDAEFIWVLDPIDGTKSFICGAVTFGTLIGLLYKNQPVFGAMHLPGLGEYMYSDNEQTFLNEQPVKMRSCDQLYKATLLSTELHTVKKIRNVGRLDKLLASIHMHRHLGDCYGYYLVASGFADIMVDPVVSPWDIIPIIPIVRGAGGVITDWHGQNATHRNSAIAASTEIHGKILNVLNGDSMLPENESSYKSVI